MMKIKKGKVCSSRLKKHGSKRSTPKPKIKKGKSVFYINIYLHEYDENQGVFFVVYLSVFQIIKIKRIISCI